MKLAKNHFAAERRETAAKPTQQTLQFSIATCWDDALLDGLVALQREHPRARFVEVYGAHRTNITGHGRPAYRLPEVSAEVFERHVRRARELGLRFNYVMNAPDFGGRETSVAWLGEVSRWLKYLAECGVTGVTISHPDLLQFVKREFPDFRLNVSVITGVDTVAEARRFEDIGADVINLNPFTINRDFDSLRAIRQAVDCELELYANIPCLDRCPRRDAHYRYSGRASQAAGGQGEGINSDGRGDFPSPAGAGEGGAIAPGEGCRESTNSYGQGEVRVRREGLAPGAAVTEDPFLMHCSHTFLSNPVEFLRSPFIRPEDVPAYRQIGMDFIKLSDRTEGTAFLLQTAKAYAAGHYDGNLFDLIFRSGRKIRAGLGWVQPGAPAQPIPVIIRNSVLTELKFIEQIKKLRGAKRAEFYTRAAARAVSVTNPQAVEEWLSVLQARIAA
jgi:collagenase-like PrtC family protease